MQLDHVGDVSPALLVQLAANERVLVPPDMVRYRDPSVKVDRVKLTFPNPAGGWPLSLWRYFETLEGPGTATVSTGIVGEIRLMTLAAGESMLLHHAALLAHEATMGLSVVSLAAYQLPGEQNQRYLEAVHLGGPGQYAIQTFGNALSFELKAGEWLRAAPHALLALKPGTGFRLNIWGGSPRFPPNHYFPLLDIGGPGTVMVHSGEYVFEGPRE
ncbi:MAG TPA: AIM24 family protein [Thermoplasmata archaeon]|nr:AIM24 family protein [Thermoplasmata archaeon]